MQNYFTDLNSKDISNKFGRFSAIVSNFPDESLYNIHAGGAFFFDYSSSTDRRLQLIFTNKPNKTFIRKFVTVEWNDWEQIYPDYTNINSRRNGYIKFSNNLILQWGEIIINSTSYGETTLSIQFPNIVPIIIVGCTNGIEVPGVFTSAISNDARTKILLYSNGNVLSGYNYLAIGF